MECGVDTKINYGNIENFPKYFKKSKNKQTIFDSNLKGKPLPENAVYKNLNIEIEDEINVGLYKLVFEIQNEQINKHFTDIAKGILINNEIKDVYFHKIDVISENEKTTVTAIFEVLTNPFPLIFVIYAIGAIGVSITATILLKNISKVVNIVGSNIIKIGASLIVVILGVKVISKW